MRELTSTEVEQAAGGIGPVVSLLIGLAAAYLHDKYNGADGVDKAVKAVVDYIEESHKKYGSPCSQNDPSLCMAG